MHENGITRRRFLQAGAAAAVAAPTIVSAKVFGDNDRIVEREASRPHQLGEDEGRGR